MLFWKRDFYPVKYGNLGYPSLKPGAGEIIPTNFQIQSFQNVPLFCEGMGEKTCFKSLTCSRFLPESKGFCLGGWEAHWFRFKDVSRTMADQQIGVHTVVVTNWFFILLYFLGKGSVEFNFWVFVSCPLVPYRNDHFIQRHPKTFFFFILLGL